MAARQSSGNQKEFQGTSLRVSHESVQVIADIPSCAGINIGCALALKLHRCPFLPVRSPIWEIDLSSNCGKQQTTLVVG
jgi:hypothetical protein